MKALTSLMTWAGIMMSFGGTVLHITLIHEQVHSDGGTSLSQPQVP